MFSEGVYSRRFGEKRDVEGVVFEFVVLMLLHSLASHASTFCFVSWDYEY